MKVSGGPSTRNTIEEYSRVSATISEPEPPRFLSREAGIALVRQILDYTSGHGQTWIELNSLWRGDVRWARNRVAVAGDWRDDHLDIERTRSSRGGRASTNQLDARSLRAAVGWAERMMQIIGTSHDLDQHFQFTMPPGLPWANITYATSPIWSDRTYDQTAATRAEIATQLTESAERAAMLSAGYLSVEARGLTYRLSDGRYLYSPQTRAQCSMTVRDPQGMGSGWAGASSYDWGRFDAHKLAEIALDKCLRSRNPVAIEPGRYTLIMESQATYDLISQLVRWQPLDRNFATNQINHPFYRKPDQIQLSQFDQPTQVGNTKIGERVLDERICLNHDPMDPDLGVIPFRSDGEAYAPVTWIDRGVLTNLAYDTTYAQYYMRKPRPLPNSGAFKMGVSGPMTSVDEMIATTKRGLVVTRFWGVRGLQDSNLLCTGLTRDGLWLIENGKISKPVKNMRWTESALLAFNNVEQLGVPVPVFSPDYPAVVPPIKVRDFSFTALADAI